MAETYRFHYSIESKVNWTAGQEKSLSNDYPFDLAEESAEHYVARVYLQFLWLPESIMPLQLLVPSLRRVNAPSNSSECNSDPLHSLLEPLLLTARSSSKKYHEELPQILDNGGGAGEIEETMMWYALNYEKGPDGDNWTRSTGTDHADGPWIDAKWRQNWLERMERREVQIQILLYMLKLSLPESPPLELPKKRKRLRKEPLVPISTVKDHLEAFMDKLSMWQLMGGLSITLTSLVKDSRVDHRDWIQILCEDIVEPQFKIQLPELCSLFRSKVFPNSPFSDGGSTSGASRSSSPDLLRPASNLPTQSTSASRHASPALSTASYSSSSKADPKALQRSRSLSLSLAQERERKRSVSIDPSKKRVLNREVSMSRVFKPKPKPAEKAKTELNLKRTTDDPQKALRKKDVGITLVEDTPVKPKAVSVSASQLHFHPTGESQPPPHPQSVVDSDVGGCGLFNDTEEEIWEINTFPRFHIKGLGQNGDAELEGFSDREDDEAGMLHLTPSKPSNSKKRS